MAYPKSSNYTRQEFLDYYEFEDEPELLPKIFHKKQNSFVNLIEKVQEDVAIGIKPRDAVMFNAGITQPAYSNWKCAFEKEIEDGKTDTPLIRLFKPIMKADARLYRRVMQSAMRLVDEGDGETTRFMIKNRLGYNATRKKEVEVSANDDFNFNINLVSAKQEKEDKE